MEVVLRFERGLQVGRVVNGVGPRVGRQQLVVLRKALLYIHRQGVVIGRAVGVVGYQVTEGDRLIAEAEVVVRQDLLRQSVELWRRVVLQRGVESALAEEADQRRRNVS